MKVRLTQPGFEAYTGQMGVINFENGLSIDDVSRMDALRLSAVMACEAEDGSALSLTQEIIDKHQMEAPVVAPLVTADQEPVVEGVVIVEEESDLPAAKKYTEAELEKLADEQGIRALRAITDQYEIKANSIAALIKEMIKAGHAEATPSVSE